MASSGCHNDRVSTGHQVKVFITRFRKNGQYTYVDKIDAMMPKRIKAAVIDYNDLGAYPMLDSMFNENPDRILRASSAAIAFFVRGGISMISQR